MPLTVVGYIRVSTGEQLDSGAGLEAQRYAIRDECARRGWRLTKIHEDAASGRAIAGRPGLKAALTEIESHMAGALVVAKLDRLSRSLLDFSGLMERSRKKGWALVALDLGVDTTTPSGEMMANVLAVFAQFERRLIGQRTREALAVKRQQGVRLGRPPVLAEAILRRIRRERSRGRPQAAIAARLDRDGVPTAHGGRRWHVSAVQSAIERGARGQRGRRRAAGRRPWRRRLWIHSLNAKPLQTGQRLRIGLAGEVFLQARRKDRFLGRRLCEQRHRRTEFHIVGRAEDFSNRTPFNARDQHAALAQPQAKHRVRQVCGGFVERRERELMRHHAVAQPRDLRKDEPHPVTALATGAQLAEHCFIYRLLRIDKPLQLKAIVHRHLRSLAVKVASFGEPTDTVVMDTSTRRRFTITMKDSDEPGV